MEDAAGALAPGNASGKTNGSSHDSITSLNKKAHEVVDRAAQAATQTADWLAKSPEHLKKKANDYASAHPFRTVGISFLTGLLIGRLFR
jgi:ElaB/YqjD/DUF883 family membrane-anchored ribosome-binding protein